MSSDRRLAALSVGSALIVSACGTTDDAPPPVDRTVAIGDVHAADAVAAPSDDLVVEALRACRSDARSWDPVWAWSPDDDVVCVPGALLAGAEDDARSALRARGVDADRADEVVHDLRLVPTSEDEAVWCLDESEAPMFRCDEEDA